MSFFQFPPISSESLKMSGIGKAVMYLYKHPREIRVHKEWAGKLVSEFLGLHIIALCLFHAQWNDFVLCFKVNVE